MSLHARSAPAGVKALQDRIDGVLEVPPMSWRQLSTRRFLSMPGQEQEDLLQGLLSRSPSIGGPWR